MSSLKEALLKVCEDEESGFLEWTVARSKTQGRVGAIFQIREILNQSKDEEEWLANLAPILTVERPRDSTGSVRERGILYNLFIKKLWAAIFLTSESWKDHRYSFQNFNALMGRVYGLASKDEKESRFQKKIIRSLMINHLFTYSNIKKLESMTACDQLYCIAYYCPTQAVFDLITEFNVTQIKIFFRIASKTFDAVLIYNICDYILDISRIKPQYQTSVLEAVEKFLSFANEIYRNERARTRTFNFSGFKFYFKIVTLSGGAYTREDIVEKLLKHLQACYNSNHSAKKITEQIAQGGNLIQALRFICITNSKEVEDSVSAENIVELCKNRAIIEKCCHNHETPLIIQNPEARELYVNDKKWELLHLLDPGLNLSIIAQLKKQSLESIFLEILELYEYTPEDFPQEILRRFIYASLQLPTFLSTTLSVLHNLSDQKIYHFDYIEILLNLLETSDKFFLTPENKMEFFLIFPFTLVALSDSYRHSIDSFYNALTMIQYVQPKLNDSRFPLNEKRAICDFFVSDDFVQFAERTDFVYLTNNSGTFYNQSTPRAVLASCLSKSSI